MAEEKKLNVYEKLNEARIKLQNSNLKKTGNNKFAGFKYYQLEDFIPTLNVIFKDLGLIGVFNIIDEVASLAIIDVETKDDIVFASPIADASIKGCTPIQSLGGVHTYMKRYLYLNALEITEGDMLDSQTGSEDFKPEKKEKKKVAPMTQEQRNYLGINLSPKLETYACQKFNISSITELNYDQAQYIIDSLEARKGTANNGNQE